MSGFSEAKVRALMREHRCDWRTACREIGRRGGCVAASRLRKRPEVREAAVRRTWMWARDFL